MGQDAFAGPSLEDGKFKKLDDLLKQSELYTTFLVENIKEYEQQRAREAEGGQSQDEDAADDDGEQDEQTGKGAKKGGKRKAATKGGRGAKRSKKDSNGRKKVRRPEAGQQHRDCTHCVCRNRAEVDLNTLL